MDPLSLFTGAATTIGMLLALLNIREKVWPRPTKPHPLEAAIRDVAAAVRERGDLPLG